MCVIARIALSVIAKISDVRVWEDYYKNKQGVREV